VGGGSRNRLLNQFAANALEREVIAGPVEATAAGNLMVQLLADGRIESLEEGRALIRHSFDVERFTPAAPDLWQAARQRFLLLDEKQNGSNPKPTS
jgi:rhamnulokinase